MLDSAERAALDLPPPYWPVAGRPVYQIHAGESIIFVAERELVGPLRELVMAALAPDGVKQTRAVSRSGRLWQSPSPGTSRQISVVQAAELLGTGERFPRRLIAERRIRFVRVGRHVRIPQTALREFTAAGVVEPLTPTDVWPEPWRAA